MRPHTLRNGRTPTAARTRTPWRIVELPHGRTYVDLPQARTQGQAEAELADMLRYHTADSPWRARLAVRGRQQ